MPAISPWIGDCSSLLSRLSMLENFWCVWSAHLNLKINHLRWTWHDLLLSIQVTLWLYTFCIKKACHSSFWPPFSSLRCSVTPHLLLRQPPYQRVRASSPVPFVYSFRAGMICCCKQHIWHTQMTTLWKAGNERSRWTSHVFVGFFWAKRIVRSGEGNLVSLCTAFCFKYWLLRGRKGLRKNFPSLNLWIRVWHQKCLSNQYQVSGDFCFLIFSNN